MQLGSTVKNLCKGFSQYDGSQNIHLGFLVFIFIYFFFSWRLLLLMYYLYGRKLDSEDSSILQISFLILSIKNAQAAGSLAWEEPQRSGSCLWSSL